MTRVQDLQSTVLNILEKSFSLMNYSIMAKFLRFPSKQKISNLNVLQLNLPIKISCTSYVSVRHQGLCIGSHFKLINDPLRINLIFHTFPTEEIYAVHGGGGLNKGREGNFVDVTLTN